MLIANSILCWGNPVWSTACGYGGTNVMLSSHFPKTALLTPPLNLNNGKNQTPPLRQSDSRATGDSGRSIWNSIKFGIRAPETPMDHFINTSAFSLLVCKMRMTFYDMHPKA